MNNLLKNLCILLSLFYFSAASSKGQFSPLLDEVRNLRKILHNNTVQCEFVPSLGNIKNSSVDEVSCRALESLQKDCNITNKSLIILKKYLEKYQNKVECVVIDRQEDIFSFLTSLSHYFKKQNFRSTL